MNPSPKIMIAGTHGFVGARALAHHSSAVSVPHELVRRSGDALTEFVMAHQPDIILNAAAISDIGTCENHPDDSYDANVRLPYLLARAAAKIGAKFVSFSSDQVYTGCKEEGPFFEDDPLPAPANFYARHKLEAEERVLDVCPDAVLLRATWMYDMPLYNHANRGNFLVNTLGAVMHGRALSASSRDYRGITYVRQVVSLLPQVYGLPGGVYNYGSENPLDMHATTEALLSALGLQVPVKDTLEKRRNLWMNCEKLRKNGIFFDTTAEGFARCVEDYGLRW